MRGDLRTGTRSIILHPAHGRRIVRVSPLAVGAPEETPVALTGGAEQGSRTVDREPAVQGSSRHRRRATTSAGDAIRAVAWCSCTASVVTRVVAGQVEGRGLQVIEAVVPHASRYGGAGPALKSTRVDVAKGISAW